MSIKMEWISESEDRIGLLKTKDNPKGVVNPKKYEGISTNMLIMLIYAIFAIIDISIIIIFYK